MKRSVIGRHCRIGSNVKVATVYFDVSSCITYFQFELCLPTVYDVEKFYLLALLCSVAKLSKFEWRAMYITALRIL